MKKLLLSAVTVCLLGTTPLLAADLPYKALPPPAIFNWSGFYFGVHGGGAWANVHWGLDYGLGSAPVQNISQSSGIFGGHIGLQRQFDRWVLGVELSATNGFGGRSITGVNMFAGVPVGEQRQNIDWLYTATARFGYAWNRWLTYVKGGYAAARIELNTDDNVAPDFLSRSRKVHSGWTVGVGGEYALTDNLIFGVEYNYVDLGRGNDTVPITFVGGAPIGVNAVYNTSARIQTLLARLSLKFDWAAPAGF